MSYGQIRLSPEGRVAIRRALSSHPGWDRLRSEKNYSLATMNRDDFLAACQSLEIDARAIVERANNEAETRDRENAAHKAQQAARAFDTGTASTSHAHAGNGHDSDLKNLGLKSGHDAAGEAARAFDEAAKREILEQQRRDENAALDAAHMAREAAQAPRHAQTTTASTASELPANAAGKLMALIAEIAGSSVNPADVARIVDEKIAAALQGHVPTVKIELHNNGVKVGEIGGHKHPMFARLLRAASCKDANGYAPNIWIAGPAGSGKTFAAGQVAKALNVPFHFNGAIGMAHELLGFIDANGVYHRTPFREAYEHGGTYLFDEVDGSDNAALLALNAALANGKATFPDGQITRHANCVIIASANTWGFGGTADYVGRSKIDAAFLDRFSVKLSWNYDEVLERNICGNAEFAERVQRARQRAKSAGLKVLISPRASFAGAALIAAGASIDEAAEETFLANLTDEQKRIVEPRY